MILLESSAQELSKGARAQCNEKSSLRAMRHEADCTHVPCMTCMSNKKARHLTSCKNRSAPARVQLSMTKHGFRRKQIETY